MNALQLGIDPIPREELWARWNRNHEDILKDAAKSGLTLPFYLEQLSPVGVKGWPEDAFGHLQARDALSVKSNPLSSTATVHDFLDGGRKEALFWAQLDLDYDLCSSIHEFEIKSAGFDLADLVRQSYGLEPAQKAGANTDAGATDNTPFKPRYTRALYENRKFRPPVTIADIASGIETIPGTTFQIPKYDTPPEDEYAVIVPEGGEMVVTTLSTQVDSGRTFMVGEGLATSRKFELNDLRMQTVRMWIRRVAMRHEAVIVNRGLNILHGAGGSGVSLGSSTNLNSIIKVVLHYVNQVNNGYQIDKLFALQAESEEWMVANIENPNNMFRPPEGRFSNIFGGVQLGGSFREPPTLYPVGPSNADPNIGVNFGMHDLLGIDSRFGLIYYRQARGFMQEEKYEPRSQLRERYLSQEGGWQNQDAEASVLFKLSP